MVGGSTKGGNRTATTYRILVTESATDTSDRAHQAHSSEEIDAGNRAHQAHGTNSDRTHSAHGPSHDRAHPDTRPCASGAHNSIEQKEREERADARDAGQAGALPQSFPFVTESESVHNPAPSALGVSGKNNGVRDSGKARKEHRRAKANTPCVPPPLEEFVAYALSIDISEQDAREQWEEWQANEWHDGNDTPIRHWTGKLVAFRNSANLPSHKRARKNGANGSANYQQPRKERALDKHLRELANE